MIRRLRYIGFMMALLLIAGGAMNCVWAATVTYHVLTLPINPSVYDYHMKSGVTGFRLEAFKIVVYDQTIVELPAHYKSPLVTSFTYYKPEDIFTGNEGKALSLYDGVNGRNGFIYKVKGVDTADPAPTPVTERTDITTSAAEYYVIYTYDEASNDGSIAKLDGSVNYNIGVKGKGFLSLNRGRNNRPAVIPTAKVDPEMLASQDFSYVESPGNNIGTYWADGNNKNTRDSTESKFFFIFKFEGKDPYHIVLRTSYARNYTYIEKNEDGDKAFVYKWHKGAALMGKANANAYLASDDHIRYKTTYLGDGTVNPQDPDSDTKTGYFHGNDNYWSNVALLNNTSGNGYVFIGSRTVEGNGNVPGPKDNNKYYYLTFDGYNNLKYVQISAAEASNKHTIEGIYPIKKVTFKIVTPFYDPESPSNDHIVSVADWVSQYTVEHDVIETKYLPQSLRRKYCTFTGKFYKDPRCREVDEITTFSAATYDNTEGYQVYVGYRVNSDIPFKAITPAATYNDDTWKGATWYELIDEGSERIDGLKLKYDGTNFKNNGAYGEFLKTSEYAFIGDPYELRVVLRSATSGASPSYVGAANDGDDPPVTGTLLTASTSATEGYIWELPYDGTAGSFVFRKYKGTGNWYWNAGHPSPVAISYTTKAHTYNVATANAQTVTFIVSDLGYTEGDYIKVTAGGTNASQVAVTSENIHVQTDGTATFTAAILGRGDSDETFTLSIQKYNSSDEEAEDPANPSIITVNQNNATYTANTVQYSTASSTRVKVLTLPEKSCNFYIVDRSGNLAIMATANHTVFSPLLGYSSIPEVIRSPFIYGEDITFWSTYSDGTCSNEIHETSNVDEYNIYVKYTLAHLAEKNIKLNNTQRYKVNLNKEYIYYNTSDSKIKSTAAVLANDYYSWTLEGGDPYAMRVANVGLSAGNTGMFVKVDGGTWGDDKALTFVEGIANGSRFIAMSSLYTGIYEVMAATGDDNYYHIGRPYTTGAETKIYSVNTSGYAHGEETLQFELAGEMAVTYHLIDKADNELLTASSYNPRLTLPAEYVSPLVGEYYYYPTRGKATDNQAGDRISEITQDTYEDDTKVDGKGDNHVYVTYVANDIVNFNKGQYMLKFLDPYADGYHLEDGNDKLTTGGKIKAVYPYCNGDGNLNIYGAAMQEEQFNGGANTRPRWVWYFDSKNDDPYHVKIRSKSTIKYNDISHYTYLTTYVVHFNQDASASTKHVVTGGTLPTIASVDPTEYMVLGTKGNYRLMTTNTINDGTTNVRRSVTSLEQYWKTYNMIKLDVLGIAKSTNAYSDNPTTWVVPADKRTELETKLVDRGVGAGQWHSYTAYANATRWNGYNDKSDGKEKKVVENLEHWYQTFDMGNGTFNIESADIPPVLVLLDRHGWEIMRRPLPPATTYPEGDVELKALRVYDSPLVDSFFFYSNATKATGCHKYTLRMQDGQERDQIKVNGKRFGSKSLGDLPPITATGVLSGGVIQDFYVIYTVKEEYEGKYAYDLEYTETKDGEGKVTGYTITSETGTSQPYIVLQNGRFYKTQNSRSDNHSYISKPVIEHTNPEGGNVNDMIVSPHNHGANNDNIIDGSGNFIGNNFWYVKPNLNIDEEMGITWGTAISGAEPLSKVATQVTYKDKSGFDPYNIQLQLVNNNDGSTSGKYLTTHMTSAHLDNGILVGDYTGGSMMITLETAGSATVVAGKSEGYDHTDMRITNQTFMAVSDVNGNMQLMPRFDHTKRVDLENVSPWESQLKDPVDHAKASVDNNNSMGAQTTFFVSPQRFHYHIIDNNGREALAYKRGADSYPAITDHFKSPMAKDFVYYTGLATFETPVSIDEEDIPENVSAEYMRTATTEALMNSQINLLPKSGDYYYQIGTRGVFTYKKVVVTKGFSEKEITSSFAAAGLSAIDNDVYVRYSYDEDADRDADYIMLGRWFTVKLAEKDMQANGTLVVPVGETQGTGIQLYSGESSSRSLTAASYNMGDDNLVAQADTLKATGDYYFRVGTDPYTYYKVTVTTAYDPSTPATHAEYETPTSGSYATEWSNSKPLIVNGDDAARKWQWKFLAAPADPSSDYYEEPDPYAIQIFNREANYTTNPSLEPSPMAVGIKVPDANDGADRFAMLLHPSGGYAFVVAKEYGRNYNYLFLNGEHMTIPSSTTAATTYLGNPQKIEVTNVEAYTTAKNALSEDGEYYYKYGNGDNPLTYTYMKIIRIKGVNTETIIDGSTWNNINTNRFTYKDNNLSVGSQILLNKDVQHYFTYKVITNGNKLAIIANQTSSEAESHDFAPYLPESAQTPLLNEDDYLYYGFASGGGDTYSVIPQTKLYTLSGLYDDDVYVRYNPYDINKTPFKVPNRKAIVDDHVARDPSSVDVSMNIEGELPYNIIWYNDNMMSTATDDATTIFDGGSQTLSGLKKFVWYFEGSDPYALKIKHKLTGNYVNGTSTLTDEAGAKQFMLLRKDGYNYGVFAQTGDKDKMLSFEDDDSDPSTAPVVSLKATPNKFIIFGLSVHDLIYRLVIAKTCTNEEIKKDKEHTIVLDPSKYVDIPYMTAVSGTPGTKRIYGSTQRDLESVNTGEGTHYAGEKYQLGETLSWNNPAEYHTYCHDAGAVSIGDDLKVPNDFNRPNCTFEFYIAGIFDGTTGDELTDLETKYKGLKLNKLMSDADLIDETVVVNIVYSFNQELATNNGMDFVRSTDDKCWYTFETSGSGTPYLAHYTNAWGLQSMEGRETRYTNDYLWTPVGDVYGFKLYNRYMIKNSGADNKVMTFAGEVGEKNLLVAEPGGDYTSGNEVFELLTGDNPNSGYFRVHPVVNNSGDQYYVWRDASDGNYAKLSTTPSDWTFGLSMDLMAPYYERAGYVGGLTAAGKTAYETALTKEPFHVMDIQHVVYDDANIIPFTKGYYRLHSVPGTAGISPVRYASGYLHNTELTGDGHNTHGPIPMHFYSKVGVTGTFDGDLNPLSTGFTETDATEGDIPVPATEDDPSTIFYLDPNVGEDPEGVGDPNPRVIMSTQGLYIKGNITDSDHGNVVMTATSGEATKFSLIDIGGAVLLITNKLDPATRSYMHYGQEAPKYDLKYYHNSPTNEARWCIEPANNKGLTIATNNGGDGYYYATFYAPYDVLLPNDVTADPAKEITAKTYNAYVCKKWHNEGVNPKLVPAVSPYTETEGKFVPAGTPVIIRTDDESGSVTMTLPTTSPRPSPITTDLTGEYLEQLLPLDGGTSWDRDVYAFGLPMTSSVTKDVDYNTTGDITAPLTEFATSGVGFYINATPNKEADSKQASWTRNNRYVLHNKIYYRAESSGGGAPEVRDVQYVPVIFGDDEGGEEEQPEETQPQPTRVGDGCVYDILGRKVASAEEVKAGTWYRHLSPGVYIVNGQKVFVGVGRM